MLPPAAISKYHLPLPKQRSTEAGRNLPPPNLFLAITAELLSFQNGHEKEFAARNFREK
jgi:hypothetical protein